MTFCIMFDGPLVTRHSTFGDLLDQVWFYVLFSPSHLLALLCLVAISFTPLIRLFDRRVMVWSVPIYLVLRLFIALIYKGFSSSKLSDLFVGATIDFIAVSAGFFMFFVVSWFSWKFRIGENTTINDCKNHTFWVQALVIISIYLGCNSFGGWIGFFTVPIAVIAIVLMAKTAPKSTKKSSAINSNAIYHLGVLIVIGIALSTVKISTVVCNTPLLKECFRCH